MSGGKNNPEYLFHLAGFHKDSETGGHYTKPVRGWEQWIHILPDGDVSITDQCESMDKCESVIVKPEAIKALYFKLRSLGYCKDEKKEKRK